MEQFGLGLLIISQLAWGNILQVIHRISWMTKL